MHKDYIPLHVDATAPAAGPVVPAPGVEHAFEVVATATGTVGVTVEPRWGLSDPGTGAEDLASIDGPKELTGTDRLVHVFTVAGAVGVVACPVVALSGTGASVSVHYLGAV